MALSSVLPPIHRNRLSDLSPEIPDDQGDQHGGERLLLDEVRDPVCLTSRWSQTRAERLTGSIIQLRPSLLPRIGHA